MSAKEILKTYPIGSHIIDAFGHPNKITNHYLTLSDFKPIGTILLGGAYIYNPIDKRYAEVISAE